MLPLTGRLLALAATNGLIATILSAALSHPLKGELTEQGEAWFETGLTLQFATTAAFLIAAMIAEHGKAEWAVRGAAASAIGVALFSGSLYTTGLSGPGSLGAFHWITPIGGLLMMLGWGILAIGALRSSRGFRG